MAVLCILYSYVFLNLIACWCFTSTRHDRRDSSSTTSGEVGMITITKRANDPHTNHDESVTSIVSVVNGQKEIA